MPRMWVWVILGHWDQLFPSRIAVPAPDEHCSRRAASAPRDRELIPPVTTDMRELAQKAWAYESHLFFLVQRTTLGNTEW